MTFKETQARLQTIAVAAIQPNPASPRRQIDEASLKTLANSIRKKGLIHPVVVQPADAAGRHVLIVGERRWRAAILAGEQTVPALIRPCDADEVLEVQIFENLGLGVRAALEPRDMANAVQAVAARFEARQAAAEHLGATPAWLDQTTAAANLSPKVAALLDSGRISSTGAAIQLEKLAQKDEAKAESLIGHTAQLPEGEKLTRKAVDQALQEAGGRRKKTAEPAPSISPSSGDADETPPWDEAPAPATAGRRLNSGKVRMVARILGLSDDDEEEILARLVDEFLARNGEGNADAMKNAKTGGGLVYSTEHGRMCPECRKPVAACICKRPTTAPACDGIVRVSRETKGRAGKGVTLVKGLALEAPALAQLGKQLKAACGSGGTVKDGVVEIQGDHCERVIELLRKQGMTVKRAGG